MEAARAARSSATQQHVQGGGIIMMRDTKPSEPAEYIDLTAKLDRIPPAPAAAPTAEAAAGQPATMAEGMDVDTSEEEAPVPPPFEVCWVSYLYLPMADLFIFISIPLDRKALKERWLREHRKAKGSTANERS